MDTIALLEKRVEKLERRKVSGSSSSSSGIDLSELESFASNTEAIAQLGINKLYKSTTLINGSPIILITV